MSCSCGMSKLATHASRSWVTAVKAAADGVPAFWRDALANSDADLPSSVALESDADGCAGL